MINKIKSSTVLSRVMKQFLFAISFSICFFSISCKNEKTREETKEIEIKKDTIKKEELKQENASEIQEEDFFYFVEMFSKNHQFQTERVKFPLKVMHLDENYESVELEIEKEEYSFLNFIRPSEEIDFNQKFIINEKDATIEIRGINNGIMIDYLFEKIRGKWKLKTWIDSST